MRVENKGCGETPQKPPDDDRKRKGMTTGKESTDRFPNLDCDRLRRVLETDAVGLVLFNDKGTLIDANDAFCQMMGYTREQVARHELTWRVLTPAEWVAISEEQLKRLTHTGRIGPYEKEYMHGDGSRRWIRFTGRDLGDGTVVEFCFDITETKRAEAALRESEQRFRLFVENVREYALLQTNLEGKITGWNPGAARLFGYTSEEIIGQSFSRLMRPADWNDRRVPNMLSKLIESQRVYDAHFVLRKDGTEFWAQWVTEPVYDDAGKLRGMAKVLHDETERRRAEMAVRDSLAEKEELLKEVHHRVKNNLQVITSLLNLQANQVDDPRVLNLFEETRNRVQSIASIHELLYRSVSFASISLRRYAQGLARELVRVYGAGDHITAVIKGTDATIDMERAVPFALVMNELISNSLKHGFPHGERGEVSVSIERHGEDIVMVVADTGVGLPADLNVATASSLGLKLVQMLTRQMGGEVRILPGPGAKFELRIPQENRGPEEK